MTALLSALTTLVPRRQRTTAPTPARSENDPPGRHYLLTLATAEPTPPCWVAGLGPEGR